jgi:hypothetical protein
MLALFRSHAGHISVAFDGVTVLGHSHVLYTVSKGDTSMFVDMTRLGEQAHVTEAEVIDAVIKLQNVREAIGGSICSAAVDNGANTSVAQGGVIEKYAEEYPEEPKMLRTRDPGPCIDLVAKDSAKVECFADLLSATREIVKFLSIDRIGGIVDKLREKPLRQSSTIGYSF